MDDGAEAVTRGTRVPDADLCDPAVDVAPRLLDTVIRSRTSDGVVAVRLSEVEAYMGAHDPGSHAFRGRTARNEVMFGPAGHLYVYFTYGMHWCLNVVCGEPGVATAVLLRAGEVVEGVELARDRRRSARVDRDLARGPARLASALGIDGTSNGIDLLADDGAVVLIPGVAPPPHRVRTGPRVGVSGAGGDGGVYPWRFWITDDPTVSPYRAHVPRRRR
jgi:DNA-3-methyladenine glycosylase